MAKQPARRSSGKKSRRSKPAAKREPTKPRRSKPKPARPRITGAEALAREIVAAWRRGETPAEDLARAHGRLPLLVDEAKRLPARSRQALYRAVNRLVRAPATRSHLDEAAVAVLVVRAIELETMVEVAAGDGSALAAFIGE